MITLITNIEGFLVSIDIEKAFNSLGHSFLSSVLDLAKFGYGKNFITRIETLLKDQILCALNGGTSTQYSNLERSTGKDDPISAQIFTLTLETLFLLIKKHPAVNDIAIFDHCFLKDIIRG